MLLLALRKTRMNFLDLHSKRVELQRRQASLPCCWEKYNDLFACSLHLLQLREEDFALVLDRNDQEALRNTVCGIDDIIPLQRTMQQHQNSTRQLQTCSLISKPNGQQHVLGDSEIVASNNISALA